MIAAFRPSCRYPALLITALWSLLRAVNHWADAAKADPPWIGWAEPLLLSIVALILVGLARAAYSPNQSGSGSRGVENTHASCD